MDKLELFGDRIIIQLDKVPAVTIDEYGLRQALTENYETDGGKIASKLSPRSFVNKGTVIQISPLALSKLSELGHTLSPSDQVFLTHNAVSEQYNFSYTREGLVKDFTGLVAVPHILIEGKIIND